MKKYHVLLIMATAIAAPHLPIYYAVFLVVFLFACSIDSFLRGE